MEGENPSPALSSPKVHAVWHPVACHEWVLDALGAAPFGDAESAGFERPDAFTTGTPGDASSGEGGHDDR